MTMKKRFLGLALAAMVALPATTAYADRVSIPDTQTHTQNVEVSGTVKNKDGVAPEGKIEVELPTALSFSVDQKGAFQGADYEVTNNSSVPVVVSVQEFRDTTPSSGIIVKQGSALNPTEDTRATVALGLLGTPVIGGGQTGIDLSSISSNGDDILEVAAGGNKGIINLVGAAGKKTDESNENGADKKGVQDTFNLVFKVRAKA